MDDSKIKKKRTRRTKAEIALCQPKEPSKRAAKTELLGEKLKNIYRIIQDEMNNHYSGDSTKHDITELLSEQKIIELEYFSVLRGKGVS